MLLELVMIVKNSGPVLQTVLEAVKPYIDSWTILDTGSTDGTQSLVKRVMNGCPGDLFEERFVDFKTTRNRSIELAGEKCKYAIILDDSYILKGGARLRKFLEKSNEDTHDIKITDDIRGEAYYSTRIIKTSQQIRYEKYRVHEVIIPRSTVLPPDECYISDSFDLGHQTRSKTRFKRDIKILLEDLRLYPDDTRILNYLGITYNAIGDKENSKKYHKLVIASKNPSEHELYESRMVLNEAITEKNPGRWLEQERDLLSIIKRFPYRIEPVFRLFMHEYNNKNLKKAKVYINICRKIKEPKGYLFTYNASIHQFYVPYFHVDLELRGGNISGAVEELKSMLQKYPNDQRLLNIKYQITQPKYTTPSLLSLDKTVVIHTGDDIFQKPWNRENIHNLGSGSEIMAINLAEELVRRGCRVFVFGFFTDKEGKVDYQTTVNGVQYIDYTYFDDFVQKYSVDVLIVSRFVDKLVYYNTIKRVFLWLHDIYPLNGDYIFQTHPEKFKKMLCMGEWHSQLVSKEYNISLKMMSSWGNFIFPERFDKHRHTIKKVPYRFIWSSSPHRGLGYALDMIEKIRSRYPQTTLYIFCNSADIIAEDMERIKALDYVYHSDRVSQERLACELLASHVWFYPNDFEETYCISAVEAQYAQCLVCANTHAGLKDTIANRGAVVSQNKPDEALLSSLFRVLDDNQLEKKLINKGFEYAVTQTATEKMNLFVSTLFKDN